MTRTASPDPHVQSDPQWRAACEAEVDAHPRSRPRHLLRWLLLGAPVVGALMLVGWLASPAAAQDFSGGDSFGGDSFGGDSFGGDSFGGDSFSGGDLVNVGYGGDSFGTDDNAIGSGEGTAGAIDVAAGPTGSEGSPEISPEPADLSGFHPDINPEMGPGRAQTQPTPTLTEPADLSGFHPDTNPEMGGGRRDGDYTTGGSFGATDYTTGGGFGGPFGDGDNGIGRDTGTADPTGFHPDINPEMGPGRYHDMARMERQGGQDAEAVRTTMTALGIESLDDVRNLDPTSPEYSRLVNQMDSIAMNMRGDRRGAYSTPFVAQAGATGLDANLGALEMAAAHQARPPSGGRPDLGGIDLSYVRDGYTSGIAEASRYGVAPDAARAEGMVGTPQAGAWSELNDFAQPGTPAHQQVLALAISGGRAPDGPGPTYGSDFVAGAANTLGVAGPTRLNMAMPSYVSPYSTPISYPPSRIGPSLWGDDADLVDPQVVGRRALARNPEAAASFVAMGQDQVTSLLRPTTAERVADPGRNESFYGPHMNELARHSQEYAAQALHNAYVDVPMANPASVPGAVAALPDLARGVDEVRTLSGPVRGAVVDAFGVHLPNYDQALYDVAHQTPRGPLPNDVLTPDLVISGLAPVVGNDEAAAHRLGQHYASYFDTHMDRTGLVSGPFPAQDVGNAEVNNAMTHPAEMLGILQGSFAEAERRNIQGAVADSELTRTQGQFARGIVSQLVMDSLPFSRPLRSGWGAFEKAVGSEISAYAAAGARNAPGVPVTQAQFGGQLTDALTERYATEIARTMGQPAPITPSGYSELLNSAYPVTGNPFTDLALRASQSARRYAPASR